MMGVRALILSYGVFKKAIFSHFTTGANGENNKFYKFTNENCSVFFAQFL